MDRNHVVIAFLAGVCVSLGVALVLQTGQTLPRAHAQTSGGGEMFAVTGSGTQGQGHDVLFVLDGRSQRLGVYEYKQGRLSVGAIRNLEFDLLFQEFSKGRGKQEPAVREMRKQQNKGSGKTKKKRSRR